MTMEAPDDLDSEHGHGRQCCIQSARVPSCSVPLSPCAAAAAALPLLLPLRYLHSWPGSIATPVGPRLPETQKHGQCSSRLGDETFGHAYFSGDAVMAGAETADCGCFVGEPLS